jgi:hypothetical protein
MLYRHEDIRTQSALDETEEPEPESVGRSMKILNLTEGLRVTEAAIRHSADSDCNEQRAAATGQRIIRKFAFFL